MTSRAVLYLRQSEGRLGESEEDALSLDAQARVCGAYCHDRAYAILDEIRDHDLTGRDPKRPGLAALLARVDAGDVDVVVVFKLARFARDFIFQESTYRDLKQRGARVESVTEPNLEHFLYRGLLGVINQYHTEEMGAYLAAAFAEQRRRGVHHGGPAPYGYQRTGRRLVLDRDGREHARPSGPLELEPEIAPIVQRLFAAIANGRTINSLVTELTEAGIVPPKGGQWSYRGLWLILRNPTYAGRVRHKTEVYPGQHPALIDPETFDRVQAILDSRPAILRTKQSSSWLEGLVYHVCGRRMHLTSQRKRGEHRYDEFRCRGAFYAGEHRCRRAGTHRLARKLERETRALLVDALTRLDALDDAAIIRRAEDRHALAQPGVLARRETLARERVRIVEARRRAEELYFSQARSRVWFFERDAAFAEQLADVDARLAALPEGLDRAALVRAAHQVREIGQAIARADDADVRAILVNRAEVVVDGPATALRWRAPYAALFPH